MKNRRDFIKKSLLASGGLAVASTLPSFIFSSEKISKFHFDISLAEWSLHKSLFANKITNLGFPVIAKEKYGISAVEYVNQFFKDKAKDQSYLKELKKRADDQGVKNLLIMVDQEGNLADKKAVERKSAVENHFKWVEAAKELGCHSIRVNLHGDANAEEWSKGAVESLSKLSEFAQPFGINILAENHGTFSSHAGMLATAIQKVNKKNCQVLLDFANFCVRREKGDLWESPCVDWYDRYKGVKELLPYAKGLSAKSFEFNEKGEEVNTDFRRMLRMAKDQGFNGYVGVEFEGNSMSEEDGILATKRLLEKIREELS